MWGKLKRMSVWLVYNRSRYFFSRNSLSSYSVNFAILKLSFAPFHRVTKSENFPDSKIFVAKTFRIKRVNRVNFQIRIKGGFG